MFLMVNQSTSLEKKKSSKFPLIILSILLVTALGVMGYLGWRNWQLKAMVGWGIYIDETFNFSIKYPQDWFAKDGSLATHEPGSYPGEKPLGVNDYMRCNFRKLEPEILDRTSFISMIKTSDPKITKHTGAQAMIYLIEDESHPVLLLICYFDFNDQNKNTLDQIFSTFEFLE